MRLVAVLRVMPSHPMMPNRIPMGTMFGIRDTRLTLKERNIAHMMQKITRRAMERLFACPIAIWSAVLSIKTPVPVILALSSPGNSVPAFSSILRMFSFISLEERFRARTMMFAFEKS